jgi:3-phenylpropionate/cinnamic acid dioxygenase small subunit
VEKDDAAVSEATKMQEAIEFIWREAECLDAKRYDEWLQMWTEEGRYIIPVERGITEYADALNVVYDDSAMRAARVQRLLSGASMSANAAAQTVRLTSRFVTGEASKEHLMLRCAQHLMEHKRGISRVLGADIVYRLVRRPGGGLALDRKIILLANSQDALHGIGYLL